MDLKELVGNFEFGLFEDLPRIETEYFIRGEGVLALLDRIKNGSTDLDSEKFQLFFPDSESRNGALRTLTSSSNVQIVEDRPGKLVLESEDFCLSFFRDSITDPNKLVNVSRVSVLSTVVHNLGDGGIDILAIDGTGKDIENRRISLVGDEVDEGAYKQMFKLAKAGFEPTVDTISRLPTST